MEIWKRSEEITRWVEPSDIKLIARMECDNPQLRGNQQLMRQSKAIEVAEGSIDGSVKRGLAGVQPAREENAHFSRVQS